MHTPLRATRPISSRLAATLAVALLMTGIAACSDDGDSGVTAGSTTSTTAGSGQGTGSGPGGIVAEDFSLTSVSAAPGAEVEVYNHGEQVHTVTADDGAFDAGRVEAGAEGSFTAPTEPGQYPYHCEIHPAMTGILTVEG